MFKPKLFKEPVGRNEEFITHNLMEALSVALNSEWREESFEDDDKSLDDDDLCEDHDDDASRLTEMLVPPT